MTLGAIAELKVKDYQVLNDGVMHRVPHAMTKERLKLDKAAMFQGEKGRKLYKGE